MKSFEIRKNGDDLSINKQFNYVAVKDGKSFKGNGFFPEHTPNSIEGIEEIDGVEYNRVGYYTARGNCTWYAQGRYQEANGVFVPYPHLRRNANEWLDTKFNVGSKAEEGGIVVFDDGNYGHVAFVEKIEGSKVIVSESAYSTRGNDFLFKYGRTVEQICKEWGMKVIGYIKPPSPIQGIEPGNGGSDFELIPESGYVFIPDRAIKVRTKPTTKEGAENHISSVDATSEVEYDSYTDNDNHRWVSYMSNGQRMYVACREIIDGVPQKHWGKFIESSKEDSNVGKKWSNTSIPLKLYITPEATTPAPKTSESKRTYTILAEQGNRIKIEYHLFDPNQVWVNKSDGVIS